GNGFTFKHYDPLAMYTAIVRAVETFKYKDQWSNIVHRGMNADYSWQRAAAKYVELYRRAISRREEHPVHQQYMDIPG
ncbi:MAG TPA: starch synthase, partial [Bacillota bacterium]|nr:starch synthase [Bacillota bacterium]